MDKVSVIIPTYNRFSYLLNTINSIKSQTYINIEIIVINDCSTQPEYYDYDWKKIMDYRDFKIIHLSTNSKEIFGYACAGFVRDSGINIAEGKYIAFCDDDDIWFPNKIELQINAMKKTGCKMSSTNGLSGKGIYDSNKIYKIYLDEEYYICLRNFCKINGINLFDNGYPEIWNYELLKITNLCVCSSVLMEKEVLDKINRFYHVKNGIEDYDCWLRALQYTNSVFVNDICFYYDNGHGDGQNY